MSASVGDSGQEVELNLAPIIDCFTVLITYLLVTASFITLASVDVSVSATGSAAASSEPAGPPPWVLSFEIKAGGALALQVRGGPQSKVFDFAIPAGAGGVSDFARLKSQLEDIQKKWPTLTDVNVTAEPTVVYKEIVTVIHEIQATLPKVYISG